MDQVDSTKTVYTVSQFLNWQKSGVLQLSPNFQRRAVWKPSAKSQLIDSVVRGFPLPVVLLRQVQDIQSLNLKMEVVDGQQRLRTLLAYVDPSSLPDFGERDKFQISKNHNEQLAGKSFSQLDAKTKHSILGYEISTHVFPASTGDAEIYQIFARLNSTGLSLKPQEIRNSEFHGEFKSLVYSIAFETFDFWRDWRVYASDALARMDEAEAISELIITMIEGIKAKSQSQISDFYRKHDPEGSFPKGIIAKRRFESVMYTINSKFGEGLPESAFRRPALFYSLYVALYDHMYGLKSSMNSSKAVPLPKNVSELFSKASNNIKNKSLAVSIQDAMDKATADKARRDTRHRYLMKALDLVARR